MLRPTPWSALCGCNIGDGPRAGHKRALPRAPPHTTAHPFFSILGQSKQPQIPTAVKDKHKGPGEHLQPCRAWLVPSTGPAASPPPSTAASQPCSLCSAIFKTPKENTHLRLLETWRVPPATRGRQEPCSFSSLPESAPDLNPAEQTERGLLCEKVPPN